MLIEIKNSDIFDILQFISIIIKYKRNANDLKREMIIQNNINFAFDYEIFCFIVIIATSFVTVYLHIIIVKDSKI